MYTSVMLHTFSCPKELRALEAGVWELARSSNEAALCQFIQFGRLLMPRWGRWGQTLRFSLMAAGNSRTA